MPKGIPQDLLNPYKKQEITELLSRPYLVKTLTWTHSDVAFSNLGTVEFPKDLFAIPNIVQKLSNFKFLRADVKIEMRINCTAFHMGLLGVSVLPHTSPTGAIADVAATHPIQRTGNNLRLLSCSTTNGLTFMLPRNSPALFGLIDASEEDDIGTVWVDVLVPLQIASSSVTAGPVSISIFASFINPEVIGYGYNALTPAQMRAIMKNAGYKPKKQSSNSISKEAADKSKQGVISGALEAIGNFTPMIAASPLAEFAPLTAAAGAMSSFVKGLGFSKPTTVQATQPVVQDQFRDWCHGHGLDYSNKLSLHPDAKIGSTPYCECRKNKISDVINKPMLIYVFEIPYNQPVDAPFIHFPVAPSLCYKTTSGGTAWEYWPTPLAFLSQMFKSYRGGMKFYYRFITSSYTTTRVRISKFPSPDLPTSIEGSAGDNVSDVVDIRGDTEFCDPVPFLSPFVHNQNTGYYGIDDTYNPIPGLEDNSWVALSLANEVSNPDPSATTGVYVLIFAAAAEDMILNTYSGRTVRKTAAELTPPLLVPEKQSLNEIFAKPFKQSAGGKGSEEMGFCSAERYSTIEELAMRFSKLSLDNGQFSMVNNLQLTANGGSIEQLNDYHDALNWLAQLFIYYRGGLRYRVPLPKVPNSPVAGPPYPPGTYYNQRVVGVMGFDSHTFVQFSQATADLRVVADSEFQSQLAFEIPWMSTLPVRTCVTPEYDSDEGVLETIYFFDFDTGDPIELLRYPHRAAADDFQFGYQIPPQNVSGLIPSPGSNKKKDIDQSVLTASKYAMISSSPSINPTSGVSRSSKY